MPKFWKNFDHIDWATRQIFMNLWDFDFFGRFMPWRCKGDDEFFYRVDKF